MGVKHKFTSGVSDGADNTLVQPSDWNADHQLVASSTDNAIPRFDGTGGDALQDSGVTIDDSDVLAVPDKITVGGIDVWRGAGGDPNSVAVGIDALASVSSGVANVAIGIVALESSDNNDNVGIGYRALKSLTTGSGCLGIGSDAGLNLTSGSDNLALGKDSMRITTTGKQNVCIGTNSGYLVNGDYNTFIGDRAGLAVDASVSGFRNTGIGYRALNGKSGLSSHAYNTAVGSQALDQLEAGDGNTAIGNNALDKLNNGSNNVAIGFVAARYTSSGADVTDADQSVFIGDDARPSANSEVFQIVIGRDSKGKGSNTTVIGTGGTTTEFWAHGVHRLDANDIQTDTTTGTKIGTGATQKLALWGATPIAQPDTTHAESAFTENAGGTAVNDDSTFDGYTIRQVVKALRDAGILA